MPTDVDHTATEPRTRKLFGQGFHHVGNSVAAGDAIGDGVDEVSHFQMMKLIRLVVRQKSA